MAQILQPNRHVLEPDCFSILKLWCSPRFLGSSSTSSQNLQSQVIRWPNFQSWLNLAFKIMLYIYCKFWYVLIYIKMGTQTKTDMGQKLGAGRNELLRIAPMHYESNKPMCAKSFNPGILRFQERSKYTITNMYRISNLYIQSNNKYCIFD